MTVEERIARLETRADLNEKWLASIDKKVDELLALANAGKGAGWMLVKVGATIAAIVGIGAWFADKFLK